MVTARLKLNVAPRIQLGRNIKIIINNSDMKWKPEKWKLRSHLLCTRVEPFISFYSTTKIAKRNAQRHSPPDPDSLFQHLLFIPRLSRIFYPEDYSQHPAAVLSQARECARGRSWANSIFVRRG